MSNNIFRLLFDIKREVEGFHHFMHAVIPIRPMVWSMFSLRREETRRKQEGRKGAVLVIYYYPGTEKKYIYGGNWSKMSIIIFELSSNSQSSEGLWKPAKPITGSGRCPSISLLMSNGFPLVHGTLFQCGSPEAVSLLTSAADISRDDNRHTASWVIATALCGTGDYSETCTRCPGEGHNCWISAPRSSSFKMWKDILRYTRVTYCDESIVQKGLH